MLKEVRLDRVHVTETAVYGHCGSNGRIMQKYKGRAENGSGFTPEGTAVDLYGDQGAGVTC